LTSPSFFGVNPIHATADSPIVVTAMMECRTRDGQVI